MKLLVVNPPNVPLSSRGILIEPIDVLSLASWAAALGHEARMLDMDVKALAPEDFDLHAASFHPDAVAIVFDYHIPLHCDGALPAALAIAGRARALGARVVVGGKSATFRPEALLFPGSPVDVLMRFEAEPAMEALLSLPDWTPEALAGAPGVSFLDASGAITTTESPAKPFDLARLPIPDRALVDLSDYIDVRTLLSSRGCHMKCSFCHVPGFWGGWRGRPAAAVADEIEHLATVHGARKILFLDDNAPVGKRRMRELCAEITARGPKAALGCLASFDAFDPDLMEAMREAGFRWIHYGAESGSNRLLKSINKRADAATIARVARQTMEMGFRVRTSWIMDLPTATPDEMLLTRDLILECSTHEVRLHHLAIRLGSAIGSEFAATPSSQYIHQGAQNQNLSSATPEFVAELVEETAAALAGSGYALARGADEFLDVEALRARTPEMRVVSLCPLRYGLDWEL